MKSYFRITAWRASDASRIEEDVPHEFDAKSRARKLFRAGYDVEVTHHVVRSVVQWSHPKETA